MPKYKILFICIFHHKFFFLIYLMFHWTNLDIWDDILQFWTLKIISVLFFLQFYHRLPLQQDHAISEAQLFAFLWDRSASESIHFLFLPCVSGFHTNYWNVSEFQMDLWRNPLHEISNIFPDFQFYPVFAWGPCARLREMLSSLNFPKKWKLV